MKDFAISELPLHLPFSFPLSLNGVRSQVSSVTLQNNCCFFFFSIRVATSLSPGYFLSTMKVTSCSKRITRAAPLNHRPYATDLPDNQDVSRLLRRPCKSFILWHQDMPLASLSLCCALQPYEATCPFWTSGAFLLAAASARNALSHLLSGRLLCLSASSSAGFLMLSRFSLS